MVKVTFKHKLQPCFKALV